MLRQSVPVEMAAAAGELGMGGCRAGGGHAAGHASRRFRCVVPARRRHPPHEHDSTIPSVPQLSSLAAARMAGDGESETMHCKFIHHGCCSLRHKSNVPSLV
ncbi:hypothetical protein BS78_04G027300 [Paspalum vaginatum]|nr:hypothetical protein BS78_04G027300 [Paspalum vaginatum]